MKCLGKALIATIVGYIPHLEGAAIAFTARLDCNAVIAIGDHQMMSKYPIINYWLLKVGQDVNVDSAVESANTQLLNLGYKVLVDSKATKDHIEKYLSDDQIRAFIFIGHNIGESGVQGMVGSDHQYVSPEEFASGGTHSPSKSIQILVVAGCGSANPSITGLTWRSVFEKNNKGSFWFWGYKNAKVEVSEIVFDIMHGSILPKSILGATAQTPRPPKKG